MRLLVWYWYTVWMEREDIPEHKSVIEVTEEELGQLVVRLSKEFDVAILNCRDPRTRKGINRGDPLPEDWTEQILAIDDKYGRLRQR